MQILEFVGRETVQRTVTTCGIVEGLDAVRHDDRELDVGDPAWAVEQFEGMKCELTMRDPHV